MIGLALVLACARPVPAHLQVPVDDGTAGMPDVAVSNLETAVAATIGADPLARSPSLVPDELLESLAATKSLRAFGAAVREVERGDSRVERTMQLLEDEWAGTVAVPLGRGYRLRVAENQLTKSVTPASADILIALLSPLAPPSTSEAAARSVLHWLGADPTASVVRRHADQWVLAGWLAHPQIPTKPVAELLAGPQYDGLRGTSLGALLLARHTPASVDDTGHEALVRATSMALHRAAADRDREQAAWADHKAEVAEELGNSDPIGTLLQTASAALTLGASDDRAAGGALLSWAALRWRDTCAQPPCAGVDRVSAMKSAGRWHPELEPIAAAWRVLALKESLDTLEVGRDTVLFPKATVSVVDALVGTGAGPIDASVLRKARADGSVWLALARAVGEDAVVSWEGAREALGRHLEDEAERALSKITDPEWRSLVERIRSRAIP